MRNESVIGLEAAEASSLELSATDEKHGASGVEREQIKSRDRVRDLAEVYTHDREVQAMLNLVPDMFQSIDSTFLEPACGDGNFLVEILDRKLRLISESEHGGTTHWYEVAVLCAAASIYAIDISEENVSEARHRMTDVVEQQCVRRGLSATAGLRSALQVILLSNIICGDTLNDACDIQFVQWEKAEGEKFVRTRFPLVEPERDLFYVEPESLPAIHYSVLATDLPA